MQHSQLAAFWTVAEVLGTLAVFPYALAINPALVAQLPLRAAGAVLVLAPAVASYTSRITMPATRTREPAIDLVIKGWRCYEVYRGRSSPGGESAVN